MKEIFTFLYIIFLLIPPGYSQKGANPTIYTYKTADKVQLDIQVFYPKNLKRKDRLPAVIFFFGGDWVQGTDDQLVPASSILEFQKNMISMGNTCEVILFGDEQYAFFNVGKKGNRPYHQTLVLMKQFLIEEGFLKNM